MGIGCRGLRRGGIYVNDMIEVSRADIKALCDAVEGEWQEYYWGYRGYVRCCCFCGADNHDDRGEQGEIIHKPNCPVLVAKDVMPKAAG